MGRVAMTDSELVEASRRGERAAFGALVARYQEVVCAVGYSATGSWSLSHDVASALGISEAATLQRLSRGRKYLADGVTKLVEDALRGPRVRKNLVAGVLAAITGLAAPSRVDASPKGSTMLKVAIAAVVLS